MTSSSRTLEDGSKKTPLAPILHSKPSSMPAFTSADMNFLVFRYFLHLFLICSEQYSIQVGFGNRITSPLFLFTILFHRTKMLSESSLIPIISFKSLFLSEALEFGGVI